MMKQALEALINEQRDLSEDEAAQVMATIMDGEATPAQFGAFVTALRLKGETVAEIAGMAREMRDRALPVVYPGSLIDTCGTGGDASGTFNVSTAAAFIAAAAGVQVAKHGNRAASSQCGSADVLEALGARIDLSPDQVAVCIAGTGIGFMLATAFHPAMRYAAAPRREVGFRTVFNILGPLTNPARAQGQVLGVPRSDLGQTMARVLQRLGSSRALVVHGEDGLDELSISGPSIIHELCGDNVSDYRIEPEDVGLERAPRSAVVGGDPVHNAALLRAVFDGREGPLLDFTLLNAAAALVVGAAVPSLRDGVTRARDLIACGAATRTLDQFIEVSNSFPRLEE
ncbi:MAG: anthranilate phosphoribosyltransferase [Dehalococcoidia bacterium]